MPFCGAAVAECSPTLPSLPHPGGGQANPPCATMSNNFQLKVFSGRANIPLSEKIAQCLGDPLGKVTLQNFPDGETSCRIDEDVRGRDVFVVQPTCPPVN